MKKIIHLDADCFYASVEMLKNPELRNVPLAVGGESNRRGVIATCNYIAREFGVRSAMPSGKARKLCPSLVIVPPKFEDYKHYSKIIMDIYREFTDRVEPLSLDEAYLDVTDSLHFSGSATLIAKEIRKKVRTETGLSVSAGVAPLKFLAKIASDWRKPDGLFVVRPEEVESFVAELPIKLLPGVGPVTANTLSRFGIYSVKDLQVYGEEWLIAKLGKFGTQLFRMANGQDEREVKTTRERKSISVETTFSKDITEKGELEEKLTGLIAELRRRYEKLPVKEAVYKRFVKLKFNDFTRTSVESIIEKPVSVGCGDVDVGLLNDESHPVESHSSHDISGGSQPWLYNHEAYEKLLDEALSRSEKPVRLLGVGFRFSKVENSWDEDSWDQMTFELD